MSTAFGLNLSRLSHLSVSPCAGTSPVGTKTAAPAAPGSMWPLPGRVMVGVMDAGDGGARVLPGSSWTGSAAGWWCLGWLRRQRVACCWSIAWSKLERPLVAAFVLSLNRDSTWADAAAGAPVTQAADGCW